MKKHSVPATELLQIRAALAHQFPNCFVPHGATPRPLKRGIKQDLLVAARQVFPEMSRRQIVVFLSCYTATLKYLYSVREGCARVSLDGTFSGFVTKEEAEFAAGKIKSIKAGRKAAKAAEIPAPAVEPAKTPWFKAGNLEIGKPMIVTARGGKVTEIIDQPVPETLEDKLTRLKRADYAASMSDNRYHVSGRHALAKQEIQDVEDLIAARARMRKA